MTRSAEPDTATPPGTPPPPDGGVIHDIGYRHHTGPRLGRASIRRTLFVESLRGAYGLGRTARSKIMPMLLLAAMCLPAVVIVVATILTGADELERRPDLVRPEPPARDRHLRRGAGARQRVARPAVLGDVAVLLPPARTHRLRRSRSSPR